MQQAEEYLQYQIQNGVCGKVMTDEQVEELRKQIVAYASISEQLAELHKSMSAHHDFTGIRLGNLYCDPISASVGHKITARQRWTPTALQLQILENIYEQGTGTPSKQKIKEIASELAQHGLISETNVYNWFQNRRARSKRKSQPSSVSVNGEAEARPEGVGAKDKRTKQVISDSSDNTGNGAESFYFQNSDTGIDQFIGKMEMSRGYDLYSNLVDQFGMLG
ncbi:hypothetical protein V6N13_082825 [Hibiscus sabdariffa]|uniref:Homeobox domain-containing protein n=1 Tax=Hibiscus sabdariffa TaxID=183260 RepID=A0ABR2BZU7_9ROSI